MRWHPMTNTLLTVQRNVKWSLAKPDSLCVWPKVHSFGSLAKVLVTSRRQSDSLGGGSGETTRNSNLAEFWTKEMNEKKTENKIEFIFHSF